jgi:TMEM175 potassium channel family protein
MAARRPVDPAQDAESTASLHRLISFSDGVFAIAATLLVVHLLPPETSSDAYEDALLAYLAQPGPFISTTIGFLVVGSFWSSHRRIFAVIGATSGGLVWANLLFLFGVAIQPFLTAALAEHDPNRTSVLLYTVGQLGTCLAQLMLWAVAVRHRELLTERATPARIRYVTLQLLRAPIVFALSIPLTILQGPAAGMSSWGLLVLLAFLVSRLFGDLPSEPGPRRLVRRVGRKVNASGS